jgi:hypothetical protein
MINKGQFRKEKRTQKDYSLAFKLQVVDEVEKGTEPKSITVNQFLKLLERDMLYTQY